MLLPSSIQRAEALVGMAMPTVGLAWASAGPACATAPSTRANKVDLKSFMFHSRVLGIRRVLRVDTQGSALRTATSWPTAWTMIDHRLQFRKRHKAAVRPCGGRGPP